MGIAAQATEGINELVMMARKELARRQLRVNALDRDYFGEPAWNMLLHLYVASREERVNILTQEITAAADVPYTTALRWLDLLENVGEISRSSSDEDGRVTYISLTGVGLSRVERALAAMVRQNRLSKHVIFAKRNEQLRIRSRSESDHRGPSRPPVQLIIFLHGTNMEQGRTSSRRLP